MTEDSQADTKDNTQHSPGTVYTNTPYTCEKRRVTFPDGHGEKYDDATLTLDPPNKTIIGWSCHN